ncbi:uncharacterized mitochondrial protein-like protein [Tanacetum coccineum]
MKRSRIWIKDFIPMDSEEGEKKATSSSSEEQSAEKEKELSEEELQKIISLCSSGRVYVEALQKFDRDDLVKLWDLVKKRFSTTEPTDDKERELWVELKRLFEPDNNDILWKLQRYMHDHLVWRLYDTCGVHHVSSVRGHDIFMLVEKEYPLTRGTLGLTMVARLLVKADSEISREILRKIFYQANRPRFDNQSIERDRLIGIGFVLDFVEFISFTFSDKEMILVIEAEFISMCLLEIPQRRASDLEAKTTMCCYDIPFLFTPRVSALAGCDRLVSEPLVIEKIEEELTWVKTFGKEVEEYVTKVIAKDDSWKMSKCMLRLGLFTPRIPQLEGTTIEAEVVLTHWIERMEIVIDNSGCAENTKGEALLVEEFCPSNEMERLENEFWNHKMIGANHVGYTDRFHELAKLVPYLVTPESARIKRYMARLAPEIRGMLKATQPATIQRYVSIAKGRPFCERLYVSPGEYRQHLTSFGMAVVIDRGVGNQVSAERTMQRMIRLKAANDSSCCQAHIRRIFLDGYGVLVVRIVFFIFHRLSSRMPTSTKSWLWHRRLSHLNFGTINHLTSKDLVDGVQKFKYDNCDNRGLSRLDNQSIERDRLIGIGFVLDFVEFISFTFGDKEIILVIEAVSR